MTKELKTVSVSFRVSPKFKQHLAAGAAMERRSQTNFLEGLVFDYCAKHGISIDKSPTQPSETK